MHRIMGADCANKYRKLLQALFIGHNHHGLVNDDHVNAFVVVCIKIFFYFLFFHYNLAVVISPRRRMIVINLYVPAYVQVRPVVESFFRSKIV